MFEEIDLFIHIHWDLNERRLTNVELVFTYKFLWGIFSAFDIDWISISLLTANFIILGCDDWNVKSRSDKIWNLFVRLFYSQKY